MGSELQSFVSPHLLRSSESAGSHCEIPLGGLVRGSYAHSYLRAALERSLLSEPHRSTSLLSEVQDSRSPVIARFEHGDASLEQRLDAAKLQRMPLPLPCLWSVRVVAEAAAALDFHHQGGVSSALELSPRGIITIQGSTRLNAAILEPQTKFASLDGPNRLSPAATLASCLAGKGTTRRLGLTRPLLPAALIRFVDGVRSRHESTWQRECELLKQQQLHLLGPHWATSAPPQQAPSELCSHQLSLLPALFRLEGEAAVESFFALHAAAGADRIEPFRVALDSWRRERRLASSSPWVGSKSLERVRIDQENASRARIAQARFEFERRGPRVALGFAIDAAQAAPDSSDAWLLLAEIRSSTCSGSQALCLSEALCAARGEAHVVEQVMRQLGMRDQRKLAAFFRIHGDHVVADFLEPPPRWQATSELRH